MYKLDIGATGYFAEAARDITEHIVEKIVTIEDSKGIHVVYNDKYRGSEFFASREEAREYLLKEALTNYEKIVQEIMDKDSVEQAP